MEHNPATEDGVSGPLKEAYGPDEPLIDFERLKMIAPTLELEKDILAMFMELTGVSLKSMSAFSQQENILQWRLVAHRIRGSAANFGMRYLESACKEAEYHAPETAEKREAMLRQITHELSRVQEYVRRNR